MTVGGSAAMRADRRWPPLRRMIEAIAIAQSVIAIAVVWRAAALGVAGTLAIGLALVVTAAALLLVRRTVVEPLDRLGRTAARIRAGDLTATAEGDAARELHALSATLTDILSQLRLLHERRQAQAALEADITRIAELVRQPRSLDAVLDRTLRELAGSLPAIEVVITLVEGLGGCSHAVWDTSGEVHVVHHADQDALEEAALITAAVTDGDVIAIADVESQDFGDDGRTAERLTARGIRAVLVAPVFTGTTPLGAVIVHAGRPGAWPDASQRLVRAVARELAAAVQYTSAQRREHQMLSRLDSLDRVQRDFLSSVSEELRTPLTTITTALEDIEADAGERLEPEQRRILRIVKLSGDRLSAVLEGLLTLSRVESRAATTALGTVAVGPLVEGLRRYATRLRGDRELRLRFAEPAGGLGVFGDEAQVHRALANIVHNAVKFTPDGGEISVDVTAEATEVRFVVSDTGIGMAEDQQQRPLTRWLRSRSGGDPTRGGIGLEIVRSIVEHHRGSLDIDSQPGAGTRVTVTLPRAGARVPRPSAH